MSEKPISKAQQARDLKAQAEELKQKFQDIKTEVAGNLQAVLTKIGIQIQNSAKWYAPSDLGLLRKSITYRLRTENNGKTQSVEIGTAVFYGPYVEFGTGIHAKNGKGRKKPWGYKDPKTGEKIWTHGSKAQPFLTPAFDAHKGSARAQIIRAIKDATEKES